MGTDRKKTTYSGRVRGKTDRVGVNKFNPAQFSVNDEGEVSLFGGGAAVDSLAGDSGSATPTAAGVITIAGGEGIDTSGSSNTLTIAAEDASTTNKGILEIATDAEAIAKTATDKALVPSNLAALGSSETFAGLIEIATDAEALAKTATDKALVPSNLSSLDATSTASGLIEIATDAEAQTKAATDKAIVPSNLASSGFMQWADVTISATEIKALAATPKTLVAAPAAGSAIMFIGATMKLNYGGTNVFTETADNLQIKYTNGSGVAVSQLIEMTGFIDQSADTITNALPKIDAIVAATGAEAQALVLHNVNDEIAGNAADDNTVTLRIYYTVQAL